MSDTWNDADFGIWDAQFYASPNRNAVNQPQRQKETIAPMKLTFKRTDLIASIQKTIAATNANFAENQAKFDADVATATAVATANATSLAKFYGFKADEAGVTAFKNSPQFQSAVQTIQSSLGLSVYNPIKPNTSAAEKLVATLTLSNSETLEIEEGHAFLAHLK